MATLTDHRQLEQPPAVVRLTNLDRSRDVLLTAGRGVPDDLQGRWLCEFHAADGINGTRQMDLPRDDAAGMLRIAIEQQRERYRSRSPEKTAPLPATHVSDDIGPISYDFWTADDDLTQEVSPGTVPRMKDGSVPTLSIPGHFKQGIFVRLALNGGSTISRLFPGESYDCEVMSTSDGLLPTLRHMPGWDLAEAYWSFLRNGLDEPAEATAIGLLDDLRDADAHDVSDHTLVAVSHATIRFPWLRETEWSLGKILASRTPQLLDLEALAWARAFDRDPAEDDVFDGQLLALLTRLEAEPPAYVDTLNILLERLRTAVEVRERMFGRRDEAARNTVRALRGFAAAALWGRQRLVFEGTAPLLPMRQKPIVRAQKKTAPSPSGSMSL